MDNAAAQNKPTVGTPSVVRTMWDPFGFMQAMFGWDRPRARHLFEVKETGDKYVCKLKVQLSLPDQADLAHARATLDNGELTLVVPKAAEATPEPASPPRAKRRAKQNGNGNGSESPRRAARRGTRAPAPRR